MSLFLERELINNLAVRGGYVHRIQKQYTGTINTNQPYDAFNIPVMVIDPGPDNIRGNGDDGAPIQAFNLAPQYVGLRSVDLVTNTPGESKYDTYEVALTKRMSNRWSMQASASWTKSWAYRTQSSTYPVNPNSLIYANADGQDETTDYSFKLNGSFEAPAGFKLSPVYRFQAGNNYARTFTASGLNYANPTFNAEPMNARRTADINLIDLRIDRGFTVGAGRLSPFVDVYNITNANAEQNITVSSGANFLRPINIIPPRILRVGAKFDW
ncbi:MAG: hypothetical protein HY655_09720 [Acidobacteria bacterium]|nr:hypothetical protein [Acidobacteriota bacterium]